MGILSRIGAALSIAGFSFLFVNYDMIERTGVGIEVVIASIDGAGLNWEIDLIDVAWAALFLGIILMILSRRR